MAEFTGERLVPGQVEPDLYNEHAARYAFAARLARGKRVLDVACGTGYGTAELAASARSVVGIDNAADAVEPARAAYPLSNLRFLQGSATHLPFRGQSFDLVTAFEVIEHLTDYRALPEEARRVLTPGGQFLVSTPNRLYYEESRRLAGPNPFHTHEFEFAEFRELLLSIFPHAAFFLQNHAAAITIQPLEQTSSFDLRLEAAGCPPEEAHFFLAVCALVPQIGSPAFVIVPSAANALREREHHIRKLEQELVTKSEWLEKSLQEHEVLVERHRAQTAELEARNRWAEQLNGQLAETGGRVEELQQELSAEQAASRETVAQYEEKLSELERDIREKVQWAVDTETRLTGEIAAKSQELARCVELLHESEKLMEERTRWALALQSEVTALQAQLASVQASRWYRVGRQLGLGPQLRSS